MINFKKVISSLVVTSLLIPIVPINVLATDEQPLDIKTKTQIETAQKLISNVDEIKPNLTVTGPTLISHDVNTPILPGDEVTFQYIVSPGTFKHDEFLEQDIVFVLDTSNSMEGKQISNSNGQYVYQKEKHKMIQAIDAISEFIKIMRAGKVENLNLSVVSFDQNGDITVPFTQDLDKFEAQVNKIMICKDETYKQAEKSGVDTSTKEYKQSMACRNYYKDKVTDSNAVRDENGHVTYESMEELGYQFLESSTNIGDGLRRAAAMLMDYN